MSKKSFGFFQYLTLARSLVLFSSLSIPYCVHAAKVNPPLDETVRYTMNFRNVNIIEYIRFVAKISKTNFIFNEQELNFAVTLVSDQPVSAKNLFSALAQTLEVNGFSLSEQEGSILITKNTGSSQLAPLNQLNAPLVTRIYKIENINLVTLATVVKQMISKGALVESIADTHQLIVTDTAPNLDRLGQFIHDLDSSGSNLKIFTYKVKNQSPSALSEMLKQIMIPFQGANTYLTIPQIASNQLLIITTPYLLQQSQSALVSLDIPDVTNPIENGSGSVYLYTPKNRKTSDIKAALTLMAETLQEEGPSTQSLVAMINTAKAPEGATSIVFVGSKSTWDKLQEILASIDNKNATQSLFIYHIQNQSPQAVEAFLHQTASKAESAGDPDQIVSAIDNMSYVPSTNSLVFSGSQAAITKLQEILPKMDQGGSKAQTQQEFFIYQLKNVPGDRVIAELKQLDTKMAQGDSQQVLEAIEEIKWLKNTNSLLLFGTPKTITSLQALIDKIDVSTSTHAAVSQRTFLIYPLKGTHGQQIVDHLHKMAQEIDADSPKALANQNALKKAKFVAETNSIMIVGNPDSIAFVENLVAKLDTATPFVTSKTTFIVYPLQGKNGQAITDHLHEMAGEVDADSPQAKANQEALKKVKYIPDTNSLMIFGNQDAILFVENIVSKLDTTTPVVVKQAGFVIFPLQGQNGQAIADHLHSLASEVVADSVQSKANQDALKKVKFVPDTNSMMIFGNEESIAFVENLISKLDKVTTASTSKSGFIVYPLLGENGQAIANHLHEMAKDVVADSAQSKANQDALKKVKYVPDTNSMMIFGNPEAIQFVENLVAKLDIPSAKVLNPQASYSLYAVKGNRGKDIAKKLNDFANTLPKNTPHDKQIQDSLKSAKFIPETNSIMIQGSQESIAFVSSLAEKMDEGIAIAPTTSFIVYSVKGGNGNAIVEQLHDMALHITDNSAQSQAIKSTLQTSRFMPDTNSIMISGTKDAITFAETILQKIDVATATGPESSFFLYKLTSEPGNKVISKLQNFAQKLPSTTPSEKNVVQAIKHLQWIQESNSILISGNQQTIDRVSALIAQYDTAIPIKGDNKGEFLIYSPVHLSLDALEESLQEYGVALKQSGLADPNLLETINTAKVVPSANHLVFTGDAATIAKVKSILATIDQGTPHASVQQLGQSSFYVHQLRSLSPEQFSEMMKSFEANLSKSGTQDPQVAKSIDNMQYLKETNSFLFTGPASALDKIAQIADKVDIAKTTTTASDNSYDIYNPQHVDGLDLIEQMCQFAKGLSESGIKDQTLFDTINNIKWIEKSNAMIITGSPESIGKVQDLLKKFDVPGTTKQIKPQVATGFMVYKLQYHAGTEIQQALNKLAPTLTANGANPNPGLAQAINSIQWIQITNSLVASGDQENLDKLKTLISEIDVPLKQVFIEVLVIETDTNNTQNFGLQWFGKGQIKNQLGFGTGNFGSTNPLTQTTNLPSFAGQASQLTTTTTPTAQMIPLFGNSNSQFGPSTAGFDLGVIGDVLFHKGKSFLSLGSLVNALQADADSTIVMNPKIISQDNQNSKIFIGQNIPFIGSQVNNTSSNTVQSANIEYRDVGTNLSITPKLGDDDVITLEISYNASAQIPNTNGGSGGFNGIQTSQTQMTTRVHVPDQHFVVLSGMLQDTRQHYKTGIPCLGGLPIIGLAFSDNERNSSKSNILIFIRPNIVHNMDELKELTEKQENKYRDTYQRQIDKEEFDRAINFLKEASDE